MRLLLACATLAVLGCNASVVTSQTHQSEIANCDCADDPFDPCCGDGGGGGGDPSGGGGGGGGRWCPGGASAICVSCDPSNACVWACVGNFACGGTPGNCEATVTNCRS